MRYDLPICDMERGVDLLELALLMATLSDWLAICHRRVPVVCRLVSVLSGLSGVSYLKSWREHTRRHDQVGKDIARHAEGKENRLAGVCSDNY